MNLEKILTIFSLVPVCGTCKTLSSSFYLSPLYKRYTVYNQNNVRSYKQKVMSFLKFG